MNYKQFSNLKSKTRSDIEDDEPEITNQHLGYSERTQSFTQVKVYLDENIQSPKYYRGVVDKVMSLNEDDQVVYFISSKGGLMDGMISLIEANNMTSADILAVIVGECHSAASMFALSCPNISVSPSATMMVHYVSFGAGGKASDVKANVDHSLDFCSNYFRNIYQGFLTDDEIEKCIDGKELWFKSDEIIQRLENRKKYFKELEELEDKEEPSIQFPEIEPEYIDPIESPRASKVSKAPKNSNKSKN